MAAKSVVLMDGNRTIANVDDLIGALTTITSVHQQVHEGNMYQADRVDAAVVNTGTVIMLVQVPTGFGGHMRIRVTA